VLEGDMSGDVYQIILPATSIFGKGNGTQNLPLEAYARMLHGNRVGVDSVVTKMEFDTDASTPKLTFSPARFLEADEQEVVDSQAGTPEAEQAIGLSAYQTDTVTRPAPVALPPPVKAKPSGFVASDDSEEDEAPVPKAKAKVKVQADEDDLPEPVKAVPNEVDTRSTKISNVLAAWGD
jgi:hypothetical protein